MDVMRGQKTMTAFRKGIDMSIMDVVPIHFVLC